MSQGRKKLVPAEQVGPQFAHATPTDLAAEESTSRQITESFSREAREATLLVGGRIARRQMIAGLTKLLLSSDIQDLANIKESKQYKGYTHIDAAGNSDVIGNWAQFCELVEGRPAKTVDEEIKSLEMLGPDAFDAMRRGGIGLTKMRALRALPGTELAEITETAKTADKDTLLDMVGDLIARQKADKEKLQQQLSQKTAEHEASTAHAAHLGEQLVEAKAKASLLPRMKKDDKAAAMFRELVLEMLSATAYLSKVEKGVQAFMEYASEQRIDVHDAALMAQTKELSAPLLSVLMSLKLGQLSAPSEYVVDVLGGGA